LIKDLLTIRLTTLHTPRRHSHGRLILYFLRISTNDEELDRSSLYWIPKLHKCPYKWLKYLNKKITIKSNLAMDEQNQQFVTKYTVRPKLSTT
jgi:hypothetical protein